MARQRVLDVNAYEPIELKKLQHVLHQLYLAQHPLSSGTPEARMASSDPATRAAPGEATKRQRALLRRTLRRIERIASHAHAELLAISGELTPRQARNGWPRERQESRLEQALRWRETYYRAEQSARAKGRDALAEQYHNFAQDWALAAIRIENGMR